MPRPVGAPFWGESVPPEDWQVLSGSADYVESDGAVVASTLFAGGAARAWGEGDGLDGDDYVQVPSAAKLLWIFDSTWSYLQSGDTVEVSWVVRARGTGTIDVTNDLDTTWDYTDPAGASIGSASVSSGTWTVYEFPTTEYDLTELLAGAGGFRVAVDVVGAVDIDVVQLRAWPPGGALGGFTSPQPAESTNILLQTFRMEISDADVESAIGPAVQSPDFEADSTTAHGTMLAEAADLSEEDIQEQFGRGGMFTAANDNVLSNLDASAHIYKWEYDTAYLLCRVPGVAAVAPDGYLAGDEGVDYIRRPDRTYADAQGFFVWAGAMPSISGWVNAVGHLEGSKSVADPAWDWAGYDASVSILVDDWPAAGEPDLFTWRPASYVFPPGMGDAIPLPDTGSVDEYIDLDLPASEQFALLMANTMALAAPPERVLTGIEFTGQASIGLTASLELGGPETGDKVAAVVTVPPYRVWSPTAAPVSWVRNVQRNDGLGVSPWRWGSNVKINVRVVGITFSGFGSNQSIRWRGTR